MLAVAFDTLKLARKLESAGMAPKLAQDTSAALSESFTEWLSLGNIATREDVQRLEAKLDVGLAQTETKIQRWIFGAGAAQTFILLAALFGLLHSVVKF